MNLKLTEVVSDVMGLTGLSIIKAILAGERNQRTLAKLRNDRCKRTEAEIARALQGTWREEHLFALKQALELYESYHEQLRVCDGKIEAHLKTFPDHSGGKQAQPRGRRRRRLANQAPFDVQAALLRWAGVDLTAIEGIDAAT